MTKQSDSPLTVTGDSTPANICGQCKTEANPFLHYIKHRGIFRRLCTTCILRFNSQLFCPVCFSLYNPSTPLQDSTTPCSKCHSISHTSCVGPNPSGGGLGYVCSLCVSSSIFGSKSESKSIVFDEKSAAALLAAAKISYESMSKAKALARIEAEKRSKEAWSTKKRAREAIENVSSIEERNVFGIDRVDNSSAVLASLNAVELNEKEKVVVGGKGSGMLGVGENGGGSGGFGRQMVTVVDEKPIVVLGPYVQNNRLRDGNGGSFQ